MKLLMKREQTQGRVGRVQFKLWAKIELDDDEKAIVSRYSFDQALLIGEDEPALVRKVAIYAIVIAVFVTFIFDMMAPTGLAFLLGLAAGGGFGYWYYNEKREQVFVKDLMHGRHFQCPGIVDLTKQEAQITDVVSVFRQVMESAKHWGGTQTNDVPVLTLDEARDLILRVY